MATTSFTTIARRFFNNRVQGSEKKGNSIKVLTCLMMLAVMGMSFLPAAWGFSVNERISLRFKDRYVRHANFRVRLSEINSTLDRKDATFIVRPGLAGEGISLEAVNFPGYYLRHKSFALYLEEYDGKELFRADATFLPLGNRNKVAFQSVNYPDRYIAVRGDELGLDPRKTQFWVTDPHWGEGDRE